MTNNNNDTKSTWEYSSNDVERQRQRRRMNQPDDRPINTTTTTNLNVVWLQQQHRVTTTRRPRGTTPSFHPPAISFLLQRSSTASMRNRTSSVSPTITVSSETPAFDAITPLPSSMNHGGLINILDRALAICDDVLLDLREEVAEVVNDDDDDNNEEYISDQPEY